MVYYARANVADDVTCALSCHRMAAYARVT